MGKSDRPLIKELTWNEARPYAAKGCQKLLKILDEISPDDSFTFLHVRYPFGTTVVSNDFLHLPVSETETAPINSDLVPKKWRDKLSYLDVPSGLIVKNTLEIFREIGEKVFSVALSGPDTGIEMGIVEVFGATTSYTVTSGARSLYMVPRISKAVAHKKLRREYGINSPVPKKPQDHWHIFRELYASPNFESEWECELLFLTNKWAKYLEKEDGAWMKLKSYIQQKAWDHSELGRRKVMLDVVWQQACEMLSNKGIKPDPYVVDTLRHLILVGLGAISGSRPSCGNDYAGPLTEIQHIYSNVYGLENQIPTIMEPHNIHSSPYKPVYYSVQTPMLLASTPNFRNISSNIEDMRELMNIKRYVFDRDYGNLKVDHKFLNDELAKISFNYFHSEPYAYGKDIRPTKEMPLSDPDFLFTPEGVAATEFAENGSYIRGCVKISKD